MSVIWELVQLPLYTLFWNGTRDEVATAVLHCSVGDVMIASVCAALGMMLRGGGVGEGVPLNRWLALSVGVGGAAYTVFSEWLNVEVLRTWSYTALMPRVPLLGTGLSPLVQWVVVPTATLVLFRLVGGRLVRR